MPVDDAHPSLYGAGLHQRDDHRHPEGREAPDEAWALVKYLTTNDHALAAFSNGIRATCRRRSARLKSQELEARRELRDVPEDLREPELDDDADHAADRRESRRTFTNFVGEVAGRQRAGPARAGSKSVDKQIDAQLAAGQAAAAACREPSRRSSGRHRAPAVPAIGPPASQRREGGMAPPRLVLALHEPVDRRASRSSSAIRSLMSALPLVQRTTTCSTPPRWVGLGELPATCSTTTRRSGRRCKNTLWLDRRRACRCRCCSRSAIAVDADPRARPAPASSARSSTCPRSRRRSRATLGLRLHPQPGHRPGQHDPRAARDRGPALVQRRRTGRSRRSSLLGLWGHRQHR